MRENWKFKKHLIISGVPTSSSFLVLQSRTEVKIPTFRTSDRIVEETQMIIKLLMYYKVVSDNLV